MLRNRGRRLRILAPVIVLLVGALPAPAGPQKQASGSQVRPVVIEFDVSHGKITCSVDGVACGRTVETDFLYMLNGIRHKHGPDWPVIAIFHPHVPVLWIGNFQGIADKAQLNNVRCFVVNEFAPLMSEIKWGVQVPYSRALKTVPRDE